MNTIKALATRFLNTTDDTERKGILNDVRTYMETFQTSESPASIRRQLGLSYFLGINTSAKVEKGRKVEDVDTLILYLSASDNAGFEICPHKSEECAKACLVEVGRAAMERGDGAIHVARLVRTWLVRFNKPVAYHLIQSDIDAAKRRGRPFGVRLNGTSDLRWDFIIRQNPGTVFYDYTKDILGALASVKRYPNHHITFSYSGHNAEACKRAIAEGLNVAVAVTKEDFNRCLALPRCFNGDVTDLRYMDDMRGGFCVLRIKGNKVPKTPFILNYSELSQLVESV